MIINQTERVQRSYHYSVAQSQNGTGKALSILLKWWRIMGWNERQYVKLWDLSLTFLWNYTAISKMFPQYGLMQWS